MASSRLRVSILLIVALVLCGVAPLYTCGGAAGHDGATSQSTCCAAGSSCSCGHCRCWRADHSDGSSTAVASTSTKAPLPLVPAITERRTSVQVDRVVVAEVLLRAEVPECLPIGSCLGDRSPPTA